jgi:hypothetical protein
MDTARSSQILSAGLGQMASAICSSSGRTKSDMLLGRIMVLETAGRRLQIRSMIRPPGAVASIPSTHYGARNCE